MNGDQGLICRLHGLGVLLLALLSTTASAHEVGLSQSLWRSSGAHVEAEIGLAPRELIVLVDAADDDGDGVLAQAEFDRHRPVLETALLQGIAVARDGQACAPLEHTLDWSASDAVLLKLDLQCDGSDAVSVDLPLLAQLSLSHRQLARIELADGVRTELLSAEHAHFDLMLTAASNFAWWSVLGLGAEHILFGLDHLAFLLGLLLARPRLRTLLWTLSGFTVAHSLTLGLMAFGTVSAPAALIEPLIGLSVAVVAVDNLRPRATRGSTRWLLVLGFGLIHGFGFAGAIADQVPDGANLWPWLLAFNLGVECGQIAFALVAGGALWLLAHLKLDRRPLLWAGNAALAMLGMFWVVGRIVPNL